MSVPCGIVVHVRAVVVGAVAPNLGVCVEATVALCRVGDEASLLVRFFSLIFLIN